MSSGCSESPRKRLPPRVFPDRDATVQALELARRLFRETYEADVDMRPATPTAEATGQQLVQPEAKVRGPPPPRRRIASPTPASAGLDPTLDLLGFVKGEWLRDRLPRSAQNAQLAAVQHSADHLEREARIFAKKNKEPGWKQRCAYHKTTLLLVALVCFVILVVVSPIVEAWHS